MPWGEKGRAPDRGVTEEKEQSGEEGGAWEESCHARTTEEVPRGQRRGLRGRGRINGPWDAVI